MYGENRHHGTRIHLTLLPAAAACLCSLLPGLASAQSLLATQDNWVNKLQPDDTFPAQSTVALRGPDWVYDAKEAFLRFEVPGGTPITSAQLSLYRHNIEGNNTLEIATVVTTADIDTITWNTRPTNVTVIQTTPILDGSGAEVYDLTGFVTPGQTLTLRLRLLLGDYPWGWGWFRSREHTEALSRPYLNINGGGGPGTPFCPGDGVAPHTSCPCGNNNDGSMGGCDWGNVSFPSGGILSATGTALVADNDVYLHAIHVENNFGVFFGANNPVNGGNGFPLSDGLRCAGGLMIRLTPPMMTTGNQASCGPVETLDWAVAPGVTRRYQYWFRTPGGPCGQMANLSNGYEIVWQ